MTKAMSEMVVPDGWEVKKFKDITLSITCGVAATPRYVDKSEGVPFLSAQNVQSGKIILEKFKYVGIDFHSQLIKNAKPELGDILYSRVGAGYGEAAIIDFEWEFSIYVSLTLIKMKQQYLAEFYKYFLNSIYGKQQAKGGVFAGGGVPNLNVGVVKEFDIIIPPLPEQQKIASILTSVDEVIEKTQSQINKLQDLKKGTMTELLTRGIGHTEFKDSPVGRIPKGWEVKSMTDLLIVKHGFQFRDFHFSEICFSNSIVVDAGS